MPSAAQTGWVNLPRAYKVQVFLFGFYEIT